MTTDHQENAPALDENKIIAERRAKLAAIREAGARMGGHAALELLEAGLENLDQVFGRGVRNLARGQA